MLKSLLKKLVLNKKIKWLRLMYMYPDRIDAELLKIIKDNNVICHYMEMPIQHISDNILKKMNRTSDEKTIRNKIELIKKIIPDMALRTSFIVGFPTENEKDFNKLINFVKEIKFNNLAIFKYSREYGTKAYSIEKQIPYREKNLRYKYLLKTQSRILDKINLNLIDKKLDVLIDYGNIGRTYMDAPEIDGKVYIKNASPKSGNIIKAKIIAAEGYNREAVKI
jgi:ribosomal protein S12 methylthiotransferase